MFYLLHNFAFGHWPRHLYTWHCLYIVGMHGFLGPIVLSGRFWGMLLRNYKHLFSYVTCWSWYSDHLAPVNRLIWSTFHSVSSATMCILDWWYPWKILLQISWVWIGSPGRIPSTIDEHIYLVATYPRGNRSHIPSHPGNGTFESMIFRTSQDTVKFLSSLQDII